MRSKVSDKVTLSLIKQRQCEVDEASVLLAAFEGADGSVQCCSGDSEAHLCFELLEDRDSDKGVAAMQPFSCLPARMAISLRCVFVFFLFFFLYSIGFMFVSVGYVNSLESCCYK